MDIRKKLISDCIWDPHTEYLQVFSIYSDTNWKVEKFSGFSMRCVAISPQWLIRNLFDFRTASAIFISHNHPSNSEKFSFMDIVFYRELDTICNALNIRLLDFILKLQHSVVSIFQDSRISHVSQHRWNKTLFRGGYSGEEGGLDLHEKMQSVHKIATKKKE